MINQDIVQLEQHIINIAIIVIMQNNLADLKKKYNFELRYQVDPTVLLLLVILFSLFHLALQ